MLSVCNYNLHLISLNGNPEKFILADPPPSDLPFLHKIRAHRHILILYDSVHTFTHNLLKKCNYNYTRYHFNECQLIIVTI
jgi:hypothetical protein